MDLEKLPINLIDTPILLSSIKSSSRSRSTIRSNSRSKSRSRSRDPQHPTLHHRIRPDTTDIILPSIISGPSTPTSESLPSNLLPSPFFPKSLAAKNSIFSSYATPALPDYYPSLPTRIIPTVMDERDRSTPDSFIYRDEKLVRLTGRWPFNCEAPLINLFDAVSRQILTISLSCFQLLFFRSDWLGKNSNEDCFFRKI